MKYILIVSFIVLSSSYSINGGIAYSRQMPPSEYQNLDPRVETVIHELNNYLDKVVYTSIASRLELEKDTRSALTRDLRDLNIFPKLNALLADEANRKDDSLTWAVNKAAWLSVRNHINKKCQELKLS